ncbi:MAG: NAD-dependent epimerase/dehydratase family protein [Nevskiaceae bacterium]|nr:MAG: NAD-dependent epimerase/dehydratase family protein [Nevskiaceae bacterium]
MRVLIAGGTGFIGRHLVSALFSNGYDVGVLSRQARPSGDVIDNNITWIELSNLCADLAYFKPDAIINCAVCYGNDISTLDVLHANAIFPLNLMRQAMDFGCRLFIQTDSFFGKPEYAYDHMLTYTRSKNEFIWWGKRLAAETSTKLVNLRLEHVFGPGDGATKFIPQILTKMVRGEDVELTAGQQLRDFIYVEDVVTAYLKVLENQKHSGAVYCEYEVGVGSPTSLKEFVEECKKQLSSNSALKFGALSYRSTEIMSSVAKNKNLLDIGWKPVDDFRSGISKLIKNLQVKKCHS